ncbi:MAG: hypothetical protein RLZZ165_886 [Bacteroidota bacterium]
MEGHIEGGATAVIRRFTWEGIQTLLGGAAATYALLAMHVESVEITDGVVVVKCWEKNRCWGAIAFGTVILGDERISARLNDPLFMHEFGHVLQSRISGPLYLFKYGIPSMMSVHGNGVHMQHPVEQDANQHAYNHFKSQVGFASWPMQTYPLPPHGGTLPVRWWEFLPPVFPLAHLWAAYRDRNRVEAAG